ncbi:hypothetical protein HKCCE2091_12320 [Rhodobacterales bacterium HKCCE2091]|nr:hypothetical protein [Rhodobacterales bacterium HKCCE2091]
MRCAQVRIDGRVHGRTVAGHEVDMRRWIPRDGVPFETPADRALRARLTAEGQQGRCHLRIVVDGFAASFAEWRDYKYLLWVFGAPNMPNGYRLTRMEKPGTDNQHWLSRLPAPLKRWSFRERVVRFMTGTDPAVRRYIDWHLSRGATPPARP